MRTVNRAMRTLVCGLCVLAFGPACSRPPSDRIVLRDIPEVRQPAPAPKLEMRLPICPSAGVAPLQTLHPGTGHHKVTLSWNASRMSQDQGTNAVGYCLYRSKKRNAASRKPDCAACEQVNATPVVSLTCVDDLVEDGATYYYVVAAINSAGKISPPSNQFTVLIPPGDRINPPPPDDPPPSCRLAGSPPIK